MSQFIGVKLYAQATVTGFVQDSLGVPLKAVNVRLIANSDTLSVVTDINGGYQFDNIKSSYFFLTFSLLGYRAESSSHYLVEGQGFLKLPNVILRSFTHIIPTVSINYVLPMVISGDTTQFNFGAFDFYKNSLLEEALKDIPGFQVYRDGSVLYNGKQIKKVRVDNKDFFGGDLLTATRNIPADFIKNIQLINSSSILDDNSGIIKEDGEKVLNINLKEDRKRIDFGQLTAGAGTNERYIGSISLNRFNQGQELSVLGSFNNTNVNLFSMNNLGYGRGNSIVDMSGYADPIDGINKVGSIGVNVADQISKKIYLSTSYTHLYQNNITDGVSQLTSTYVGNTITRKENYNLNTEDRTHKFRLGLDVDFDNKDVLDINGNFSFMHQYARQTKEMSVNNSRIRSVGNYQDSLRKNNPVGDLEVLYSKFFNKKGRKLVGNLNLNSNSNNRYESVTERYLEYNLVNTNVGDSEFYQNQLISQRNYTNAVKGSLSFVEPLSTYSLFEFAYEYELTKIHALRLVEDLTADGYRYLDDLTVDYDYNYNIHKASLTYQYEPNNKFKMNVGFAIQPLTMRGDLLHKDVTYNYENVNLIPSVNFVYKFSKEMDWQLNYKGKNNQPYLGQIAPVIDNTNSRNIIIGNPALKAEYAHRISIRFRKMTNASSRYFETDLAYNFILNKIVNDKRTLESSTIQETTFKNTKGYYDIRWYYNFSTPIISDAFQLDMTGTTDYYNNLSFIDDRKRTTKQLVLNQYLQLKYTIDDYFESTLNANYVWHQARYDIPFRTKINIETMFLGLGAKGYLNDHWAVGLEMSQRYNDGYKNNLLNVNQTLMNSFVEFSFLRNKSALLRLQAYDLFDQNKNSGIISEYIGNDVYEARNNRLGRYYMLSLNIRLQKIPNKN